MIQSGELTREDIVMFFPSTKEEELQVLQKYKQDKLGGKANEGS